MSVPGVFHEVVLSVDFGRDNFMYQIAEVVAVPEALWEAGVHLPGWTRESEEQRAVLHLHARMGKAADNAIHVLLRALHTEKAYLMRARGEGTIEGRSAAAECEDGGASESASQVCVMVNTHDVGSHDDITAKNILRAFIAYGHGDALVERMRSLGVTKVLMEQQRGPGQHSPGNPPMWALSLFLYGFITDHFRDLPPPVFVSPNTGWSLYEALQKGDTWPASSAPQEVPSAKDRQALHASKRKNIKKKLAVHVVREIVIHQPAAATWRDAMLMCADKQDDFADTLLQIVGHVTHRQLFAELKRAAKSQRQSKKRGRQQSAEPSSTPGQKRPACQGDSGLVPLQLLQQVTPEPQAEPSCAHTLPERSDGHESVHCQHIVSAIERSDEQAAPNCREAQASVAAVQCREGEGTTPAPTFDSGDPLVYCIVCGCGKHSYVGYSVNMRHRLRQHNGELVGGAKYTKSCTDWTPAMIITGFTSKQAAQSFEAAWKHAKSCKGQVPALIRRHTKVTTRLSKLWEVMQRPTWACQDLTAWWLWGPASQPLPPLNAACNWAYCSGL